MEDYKTRIAGVYYHIPHKKEECGTFEGYVIPEPDNPHDPDAIKIIKADGTMVGYVPRDLTGNVNMLTGGSKWECTIELKIENEYEDFATLAGTCYIHNVDLGKIEVINPNDEHYQKCEEYEFIAREYMSYSNRTFIIYMDKPADRLEINGLYNALNVFREVTKSIDAFRATDDWVDKYGNKQESASVQLTLMMKHKHFWQSDKMIYQSDEVVMKMEDKEFIEKQCLGIFHKPIRPSKYITNYDESHGSSLFCELFGGNSGSTSNKSTKPSVPKSNEPYTIPKSKTDSIDWETKERSWDSDEYTDFRW